MELKVLKLDEIIDILKSNNIDALINSKETSYFEFRAHSYVTSNENNVTKNKSKLELAKDLSSISNSGGGLIVIGLVPAEMPVEKIEYVKEIAPVNKSTIDLKSWRDSLSNFLTPRIDFDKLVTYGFSGTNEELFWMKIEDSRTQQLYPLMLIKDQWEPTMNLSIKGNVIGIYYRSGAENVPLSAERIQNYIQKGLSETNNNLIESSSFEREIMNRLSRLETIILSQSTAGKQNSDNEIIKKNSEYLDSQLCGELGTFYMIAIPKESNEIENFWEQGDKSVYSLIKNPPKLREFGWDLTVAFSENPYIKDGGWENMNGCRKIVRLEGNGTLMAAVTIDGFLDWGTDRYNSGANKNNVYINLLALTEYIDMFFHTLEILRFVHMNESSYTVFCGFKTNDIYQYHIYIANLFSTKEGSLSKKDWFTKIKYEPNPGANKHPSIWAAKIVLDIQKGGFSSKSENPHLFKNDHGEYEVNEKKYRETK